MCPMHKAAWWLLWVGGINWGLVGVLNFNLVNTVFGTVPLLERAVYILVGLAALSFLLTGKCKGCGAMGEMKKM